MGAEKSSSDNRENDTIPPWLTTNNYKIVPYRDLLRSWEEITPGFDMDDAKSKDIIRILGIIIYLAWDDEDKEMNREVETKQKDRLKGDETDKDSSWGV